MKQKMLLLLATVLLTLACLGAPQPTAPPVNDSAATPEAVPSATALPEPLGELKIAYILDGNIWFWSETTSARQLTSEGNTERLKISDDGAVIVYPRGQSLWAVNADGSLPRLLVDVPAYANPILPERGAGLTLFLSHFDFQPNTHWVYFATAWGGEKPIIQSRDLHRVNADAPTPQMLLDRDGGTVTFSTDGNLLALASLTSIKVVHADGSGLATALSYPVISTMVDYIPQVVWLSDGTGFYTAIPNDDGGKSKYLFVSAGGNFSAQLAEYEGSILVISPDGLKVAYVKRTANTDELHIIEASTTDTIIASYEDAPILVPWGWSPDSKRVVFSNAHPMLLLTAGVGIPPSPLTEAISPYSLRWVDAEHFIFFREGNLLIGQINNPETILIASGFSNQAEPKEYDFVVNP
ncbi:MAG: hypothetical protein C4583_01195 [Anaerolineaceae bacterium]|nr:MAG: hypothetical protein C4583_01195 [Anaerolineaceae bacterium]